MDCLPTESSTTKPTGMIGGLTYSFRTQGDRRSMSMSPLSARMRPRAEEIRGMCGMDQQLLYTRTSNAENIQSFDWSPLLPPTLGGPAKISYRCFIRCAIARMRPTAQRKSAECGRTGRASCSIGIAEYCLQRAPCYLHEISYIGIVCGHIQPQTGDVC